jgi:peptide/nickel transport system permease protein
MRVKTAAWLMLAVGLHFTILLAGFIAPYDATEQDRDLPYAPPTPLHFKDHSGFHWRPFVRGWIPSDEGYEAADSQEFPVRFFVTGSNYTILGVFHSNLHLIGVDTPGRISILGTDGFGRDEFSRLLLGGQISLASGLVATFIALLVAGFVGIIAGYYGRWVDESLMGSAELFLSLPWLYFLIGVRAFLPLHLSPTATFLLLITVIGLIGWARPARLVRGVVLSARNRNYVLAGRGFGASDFYLLRRHILPETFGVLLTQAALLVPQFIAAEATLSFFGLGVNEPVPSWGNMLSILQQYSVLVSYAWLLAPAAALIVTSVIYWLLADSLHRWLQSRSIS